MPRMRHPNGAGPYEAVDEQVSMMRMGGWLTDDEWAAAGLPEPPPEPDEDEPDAGEASDSEEQDSKPSRRSGPRPTSEGKK